MAEDNNILDFYPESEEEACAEDSYVTLVDEDGNEVDMSVVDIVAVMKIEYDEDADEYTYVTGNEPEYDEVFVEFRERLEQELSIFNGIGDELESENELDHFDEDN